MIDNLLTPDQLGKIYQVSGRTIRRWYKEGLLPAEISEGKILLFCPEAVFHRLTKRTKQIKLGHLI